MCWIDELSGNERGFKLKHFFVFFLSKEISSKNNSVERLDFTKSASFFRVLVLREARSPVSSVKF